MQKRNFNQHLNHAYDIFGAWIDADIHPMATLHLLQSNPILLLLTTYSTKTPLQHFQHGNNPTNTSLGSPWITQWGDMSTILSCHPTNSGFQCRKRGECHRTRTNQNVAALSNNTIFHQSSSLHILTITKLARNVLANILEYVEDNCQNKI